LSPKIQKSDPPAANRIRRKAMPVYEFKCSKGHITEELVKMGTKSTRCPKCSKRAKKIISQCSFELKGGGWYADGYSSKGSGSSKKSD
jgi:putative FmdB family regulatory protein